jgi:uncharacterized protein
MRTSFEPSPKLARLPAFFLLVFALSVPFWFLGGATDLQLIPGLSVSALMGFCPMIAAVVMVYRDRGAADARMLLMRSFDFKRIKSVRWLVPVFLFMPAVSLMVYGLMRGMGMPMPEAQLSLLPVLLMFIGFFVEGLGEELGWSGYALEPLQARYGALGASLPLGLVGIVWHVMPLMQMDRSPAWIAWWCLYALAFRILTVWIFNNTGRSVFAAAIFHATLNLTYALFPTNGSHFDIRLGGLVMAGVVLVIIALWGPKTLTRPRSANL